jgi:hypothetical protein
VVCCYTVLTTISAIRYYQMRRSSYRSLQNFTSIIPVRMCYASNSKQAACLARIDTGRRALYNRRGSAAFEDDPTYSPALDTRRQASSRAGWRAIPCQARSVSSLPGQPIEAYIRYTRCIPLRRQKNSASSQVSRPQEADAAMDKPCPHSTLHLLVLQLPIRGSPVPLHL